jgi:simple sugar transport system permease protein
MSDIADFILGPFSSAWHAGNLLNRAGLLMFASSGAAFALKAGTFNLGGESQIYASALAAAIVLACPAAVSAAAGGSAETAFFFALAFAVAVLTGALLGGIPGLLRAKFGTSELLTSFLLSAAMLPVLDYLTAGPLRDPGKNLLATPEIARAYRIQSLLPPSVLNASFLFAVGAALAVSLFLSRSRAGYRLSVAGTAPEFARFAGFPVGRITVAGMTASGAFHGLTGFFAITGTWFMCHQGFSAGMGWSALAIALIARRKPLAVIPAALLYAWIESASDIAVMSSRVSFDSTAIVQGLIFLFISANLPVAGPLRTLLRTRVRSAGGL